MHEGSITIRLRAEVPEIERLNRLVRQFGELHELPGRALYAVTLTLDELVSNVILHGFDDPVGQEVSIRIEVAEREVRAIVSDGGRDFDPLSMPAPDLSLPLEQRPLGGLGIHIVRSLMDHVEYRRENNKNLLTVRKRMR
ncbi:MAG: ATP-binding protein [Verrucomicrobiaceae bacterium]|nr:MAG: ATP-binding protein [Verrucomicrobiaceae bacterium]